jgi:mRNA interferase MazF
MKISLRGEVWTVDLNALPLTSRNKGIPYHLPISPPEGGLRLTSYIMCDDISSLARERFAERLGAVSLKTLNSINESLAILLALYPSHP